MFDIFTAVEWNVSCVSRWLSHFESDDRYDFCIFPGVEPWFLSCEGIDGVMEFWFA